MDEWKTRLYDETMAPPGFTDAVMSAIDARKERQKDKRPIYSPVAKGILCIAAAVLLLVLSMPKLDIAWATLAKISPGPQVAHGVETPGDDDGLWLPGGPVLYVSNR